jgi:membrane protein implicated in regulation of membrane protease activity
MIAIPQPFLFLGLAFTWLALWALVDFGYWFLAVTCLVVAGLFAWRVDAKTRKILRKRWEKEKNMRPRDRDTSRI